MRAQELKGMPTPALAPIVRQDKAARDNVTDLSGIRSHHCFRVDDRETILMRLLSCHCDACMRRDWKTCPRAKSSP